jgi:hypothetical protein
MDFQTYYSDAKVAALESAFARVRPAGHWKAAIDVTIDASIAEIGLIKEAVTFYTGSVARVSIVSYGTGVGGATTVRARVQAAGYYATIGA